MIFNAKLVAFLLAAKRKTYAAQDSDSAVKNIALAGSKQLEYSTGDWLYRDIYFGAVQFTGQETIYYKDVPLWAMSYSGGMVGGHNSEEIQKTYGFLQDALRLVSDENPLRGPQEFSSGDFTYHSCTQGALERFDGQEEIFIKDNLCFSLRYAGGRVV